MLPIRVDSRNAKKGVKQDHEGGLDIGKWYTKEKQREAQGAAIDGQSEAERLKENR